MSEKLKPCPFCGGVGEINGKILNWDAYSIEAAFFVQCTKCHNHSDWFDTKADAIKDWQNRKENTNE